MDPRQIASLITEDPDVPLTEGRRVKDALSGLTRELMKQLFPQLIKYYQEHSNKSPNFWPTSEIYKVDRKRIYQAVQNPIAKLTLARLKYYGFQPGEEYKAQWDPNFNVITLNPQEFVQARNWSPRRETWEKLRWEVDDTIRHELEHTYQSVETDDLAFQDYITPSENAAKYMLQDTEIGAFAAQIARGVVKGGHDPDIAIQGAIRSLKKHPRYDELHAKLSKEVQKRIAYWDKISRGRSKKKRKEERDEIKAREARRRGEKICEVCGQPTTKWHEDGYYYCGCDD